jgi:hypothetical protein
MWQIITAALERIGILEKRRLGPTSGQSGQAQYSSPGWPALPERDTDPVPRLLPIPPDFIPRQYSGPLPAAGWQTGPMSQEQIQAERRKALQQVNILLEVEKRQRREHHSAHGLENHALLQQYLLQKHQTIETPTIRLSNEEKYLPVLCHQRTNELLTGWIARAVIDYRQKKEMAPLRLRVSPQNREWLRLLGYDSAYRYMNIYLILETEGALQNSVLLLDQGARP